MVTSSLAATGCQFQPRRQAALHCDFQFPYSVATVSVARGHCESEHWSYIWEVKAPSEFYFCVLLCCEMGLVVPLVSVCRLIFFVHCSRT